MNKQESLALYEQGKDAWNAWAEEMLAQRRVWAEDGTWPEGEETPKEKDAITRWCDTAGVNFEGDEFDTEVDFVGFIFPWIADFECATFTETAFFSNATFTETAFFSNATFTETASFSNATFTKTAFFSNATFTETADFQDVTFTETAFFNNATFTETAFFNNATFTETASFETANFTGNVFFDGARFVGMANFRAAKSKRAFSLTECVFDSVPEFSQMSFDEAPRLDNFRLQPRRFARLRRLYTGIGDAPDTTHLAMRKTWAFLRLMCGKAAESDRKLLAQINPNDEAAKYRALQRLAQNGHNYRLEQQFFRDELKSHQFRDDWPWHPRFWFAVFYERLSNFGASMLRPLGWLVVSMVLFAGGYLALGEKTDSGYWESTWSVTQQASGAVASHVGYPGVIASPDGATCVPGNPGDPFVSALALSGRNSLPFAAGAFTETNRQAQACLYGVHKVAGRDQPKVATEVVMLGALQTVFSLVLLFLFGLALRNHFKIK